MTAAHPTRTAVPAAEDVAMEVIGTVPRMIEVLRRYAAIEPLEPDIQDLDCGIAADMLESLAADNAALAARCGDGEPPRIGSSTLDEMEAYGGSFIKSLADCYLHADPENKQRLAIVFADWFKKYAEQVTWRANRALARESESSIPQSQAEGERGP